MIALTAARLAWRTMDFLLQSRHRPMTKGLDGAPAVGERCSKFKGAKKMATTTAIDAAAPPRVARTPAHGEGELIARASGSLPAALALRHSQILYAERRPMM